MPALLCPHCRGPIRGQPARAGRVITCPHCQRSLAMPSDPVPSPQTSGKLPSSTVSGMLRLRPTEGGPLVTSQKDACRPPARPYSRLDKTQLVATAAVGAAVVVVLLVLLAV